MGNLWHFPSRWTHPALSARNPSPLFFGCTGPRVLCVEASFSYSKQELLSVVVHGPLGTRASIAAPQHVRSCWTRDWTRDPHTGRQILNHWTTSEVPRNPRLQDWDALASASPLWSHHLPLLLDACPYVRAAATLPRSSGEQLTPSSAPHTPWFYIPLHSCHSLPPQKHS